MGEETLKSRLKHDADGRLIARPLRDVEGRMDRYIRFEGMRDPLDAVIPHADALVPPPRARHCQASARIANLVLPTEVNK